MSAPAPQVYAGPVSRAVAYLMDAFVVAALCTAVAAAAAMITSVLGARLHTWTLAAVSVCLVALPAVLATYDAVFWVLAGRTPGMAVLGLRVVPTRHRRLSLSLIHI